MVLHIHEAQSLFVHHVVHSFGDAGIPSKHVLIGKTKNTGKQSDLTNYIQIGSDEYHQLIQELIPQYSLVLFHGLINTTEKTLKDLLRTKYNKPPVVWVMFGTEIQNWKIFPSHFLDRKTRILYYTLLPYRVLVPLYRLLLRIYSGSWKQRLQSLDYIAHFIPGDLDFIYKHTGVNKPMLWHTYFILEHIVDQSMRECTLTHARDILIGNSASFTSNHIEAFDILKEMSLTDRKIVVPLSYGNKTYRKFVLKKGAEYFGHQFCGLTDFMPKEDYHGTLLNCSVMILNQNRQQAIGNLLFAAWAGMRIYLRKDTSTFQYFKEKGLNLYSIEDDLNKENPVVFEPLNPAEIKQNREVLTTIFGRENVIAKLREAFMPFLEDKHRITSNTDLHTPETP